MAYGASRQLSENIGLLQPAICYISHAEDGSIKRITKSKKLNIQEIIDLLPSLKSIICHFRLSRKSLATFNEALDVLEIKPVHLMLFCRTCISYLLTACKQAVNLLLSICDELLFANVKPDERATFMSPKSMFIILSLVDLE